ncbi:hypothetical protein L1987_63393 [Smallanthus sonchifolius]|uniref:Uncharacterized protein n=1 Tax=Smallanthus sonchifolius TaxID=185202 RepID=A0ACB9CD44_9ASTR|nr:hypothetical protein L1987_63393 [Smallanthus sonchifolius]
MVVALGPGKFYGSSLPRPRIYTDIKFNLERVDPPVPVLDPLMSWAEEAHWSMGGLSFQRHRLQGRIEGNVEKLRNQIEKSEKMKESLSPKSKKKKIVSKSVEHSGKKKKKTADLSPSPPAAPFAIKRKRRYLGLVDEDCDVDVEGDASPATAARKWPVRKLSDEFEQVANGKKSPVGRSGGVESETETVASKTRGRKTVAEEPVKTVLKSKKRLRKVGEDNNGGGSARASPRLTKGR